MNCYGREYTNDEWRILNTGLVGNVALSTLSSVMGQLSDGIWENTPAKESYWRNCDIIHDEQNKIYLAINKHGSLYNRYTKRFNDNKYYSMSDLNILEFWLKHIKLVYNTEKRNYPERNLIWSETNMEELYYFHDGLRVADVYRIYSCFKQYIEKIKAKQNLLGR